jgi:hypothetical protein
MTRLRCRVVNNSAPYSGGPGFKFRPGDRLSWQNFRAFPESLQANAGMIPYIRPRPLLFTSFPVHPFTRRYIVCVTEKALLNKLQINRMVKGVFQPAYSMINISCLPRAAFLNLFTLEEPLKWFTGLREPLHKNYYIYSSRYVSVTSKL